jgi:hypothetical protein
MKISWGTSITIVYTAFALATLGFVGFAMTQRVDLVSAEYYEEALRYDIMQQARAGAYMRNIAVSAIDGSLRLTNVGVADTSVVVDISLKRAQNPAMDRAYRVRLASVAIDGVSTRQLERGLWDVRVSWTQGQKLFQIDTVIVLSEL